MSKKDNSIHLGFESIKGLSFFIDEDVTVEINNIIVGYGLDISYSIEEENIRLVISVAFKNKLDDNEFSNSRTATTFKIKNFKDYLDSENILDIPDNALEIMFELAFCHARALHSQYTNGTKFEHIIVPIVKPDGLLKKLLDESTKEIKTF